MNEIRGTGATSRQMVDAPNGALFVWCNDRLDYPKRLAAHLGRNDLRIASPCEVESMRGMQRFSEVVIDHAAGARLSGRAWDVVRELALRRPERELEPA